MHTHRLLAIPGKLAFVHASLLAAVLILAACSNSSGLRNSGGETSTAAGAAAGQGTAGAGGLAGASGGTQAVGGVSSSTTSGKGGTTASTSSASLGGGAGSAGGISTSPAGGGTRTGGTSAGTGGTRAGTGGTTATRGGSTSTSSGGTSSVAGGSSAMAGAGGRAGTAGAGGSARAGNTSSGGGTSASSNSDAGSDDGGIVSSGYCAGDNPKLTYQGQTVTPGVTDYVSAIVMDCCQGYGVYLHASPSLGFDLAVELILSIATSAPKDYEVTAASLGTRAAVRKSSEPFSYTAGAAAYGSLRVIGADTSMSNWELGLCLEVTGTDSDISGTKIYVPRVIIGSYESNRRFQLFLLKDSSLGSGGVANQPLDSLVLADGPMLDLNYIAYVEQSTFRIGFGPDQGAASSMRSKLGTPMDVPFVVVADGARIYLGTFTSSISSIAPSGPFVSMEEIATDGFTLHAPMTGPDPRNDERIIKALTERGKLVP